MSQATHNHYPMKDSGIDWIGEIPEHWDLRKIKNGYNLRPSNVDKKSYDTEEPVQLCNYVDVYYNDKITDDIAFMQATATEHEIRKFVLEHDDVIITKDSEDPMDIGVPALVKYTADDLICGYHLTMLKPKNTYSGAFLFWCLNAQCIQSQLYCEANGVTRWAISSKHIKNVRLPIPPPSEQEAIVAYLDKATEQIDASLKLKRQQLKILADYRKSLIHEKVTKGLNPNTPLKPSGIDWLGDIPEHWKVRKIKTISSLKSGDGITSLQIHDEGKHPVYGGNGVRGYTENYTHEGAFALIGRQGALCGNINYAKGTFFATEHAVVCNPIIEYPVRWFGELLTSMNLNQYSNAAAQPGLAVDKIKNLQIPLPPKPEQQAIASYLDKATSQIDTAKGNLQQQLDTLIAYRKSLIHECVTGHKRVYFES